MTSMVIAGASASMAATPKEARDVHENVGSVRGPLSDFWLKVRSEWSGYSQDEPSPAAGGAPSSRARLTPPPNRVWVSLVHGDLSSSQKGASLSRLYRDFLSEWKEREGRNWPYAHIFDREWEKMGQAGRAQNIIMIGTPRELPPVGPLAAGLGFTIGPGRIDIGKRRYRGDNLILIFIAPNPSNTDKYALVITGTGEEALLSAGHLPYGETDYVLFRGRRLLESGHFAKPESAAWRPPETYDARGSLGGFSIRESAHYTFWYESDRLDRGELEALVKEKEEGFEKLAALVPSPAAGSPRLTYYLYPSVDRKIDETARDETVHVDFASGEIHTVYSRTERIAEPYLDLMILLHRAIGPTSVPRLERALAIALAPRFQGRDVASLAARILREVGGSESSVLRSLRDQDVMTPADGPPSAHDLLLAGFLQHLVRRDGRERAFEFLSSASPRRLDAAFKEVYGRALGDALYEWAGGLTKPPAGEAAVAASEVAGGSSPAALQVARGLELLRLRSDAQAARALEEALALDAKHPAALAALGRARFRRGDFDGASDASLDALASCSGPRRRDPACKESEAWSHLTLGRIEALRGRYVAAHVELTHPSVTEGPAPVPTLAEYWLLTMGQSRNQLTVVSHLKLEARVSMRNLDWQVAEENLKKALEIDPTDGEGHKLLGDVYHRQHEQWAWQIRYLNEVHPDLNVLGQVYVPRELAAITTRVEPLHSLDSFNDLVLRGNLELLKAQNLYAVEIQNLHAEGERLLIERRELGDALKVYRRALELNPDFFLSHFLVGRCLFLMDQHDQARRSFLEVLRRRPSDPQVLAWTHTYLGYIELDSENLPGAQHSFERALAQADSGKAAELAREGLGKVSTIRLLQRGSSNR